MKPFTGTAALALLSLLVFGGGIFLHGGLSPHGTLPAAAPAKAAAPAHHGKKPAAKANAAKAKAAQAASAAAENPLAFPLMTAGGLGLLLSALAGLGLSHAAAPAARRLLEAAAAERRKQQEEFEARNAALHTQLLDAKARKAETEALREQVSRQFQEFFRTLPVPCFCFAANGRIIRWNAACEALYGIPAAQALESTLWETIIPGAEREEAEASIRRVLAGESLHGTERRDTLAGGEATRLRCSLVPLYDAEGHIIGGLSAGVEVPEIAQYEQQIAALSAAASNPAPAVPEGAALREQIARMGQAELSAQMLEQLVSSAMPTGIEAGRIGKEAADPKMSEEAAFRARLAEEVERAARYHGPLSLILVGLDSLAVLKAQSGAEASDKARQQAVAVIKSKLRTVDVVCGLGADEYALILPETGETGARFAAERLRTGLDSGGGPTPQAACLGVVQLSPDVSGADMLVFRASAALAHARSCGPNSITHYQDMPPEAPQKASRKPRVPKKTVGATENTVGAA